MSSGPGALEPASTEFAVILERTSPRPHQEIGRLLAYHLNLHPTDAIGRVRYGGGLVVDSVSAETADRLVERLKDIGVKARRIPTDLWAFVPRGARAFALELGEEALALKLVTGRRIVVPRREIFALQLHALLPLDRGGEEDETKSSEKTGEAPGLGLDPLLAAGPGMPGSLSSRGRKLYDHLAEHELLDLELHLALYSDPFGPVRVQKNDFDYEMTLGIDREEHSLDNFLALLERVLAYVPDAWNREPAVRFLEDLDPRPIHHFKPEESENLERWLYEWSRIEAEERAGGASEKDAGGGKG